MKKTVEVFLIVIFAGFLFTMSSCDKVKDIIPIPSMTATVDGDSWTSIFRASVLYEHNAYINITGTPEATEQVNKAILLTINGTEVGTYTLSPGGGLIPECGVVYKKTAAAANGSADYYISHIATITVTELDKDKKQISGTFSATLVPSNNLAGTEISITNGKFENLNYKFVE